MSNFQLTVLEHT